MLINPDLNNNLSPLSLQQKPADSGASNLASTATPAETSDSDLDPLIQSLAQGPSSLQYAGVEVQDGGEAAQVMDSLFQSMSEQPGMALAAQSNSVSSNILGLLQSVS
jgi:hypothetical protein